MAAARQRFIVLMWIVIIPVAMFSSRAHGQSPPEQQGTASARFDPRIDAERTMQYTREIVSLGPRSVGSVGHKRAEEYLRERLKGVHTELDGFSAPTPIGPLPFVNIIAKFPGTKDGIIVIVSHYDTNYPLRNTGYVGANDGACTSALLLEFANQLRKESTKGEREGYSVWLVFTDGEEAIKELTAADSLYGSKHLAAKWRSDKTISKIKAVIVADMVGDKDLQIERDANSSLALQELLYKAATEYGYESHFFTGKTRNSELARLNGVIDDHVPFKLLGIPVVDLIDLNYGENNAYHHTSQDTIDKISPSSLQIAGDVIMRVVKLIEK